jgi:hypothetical protein
VQFDLANHFWPLQGHTIHTSHCFDGFIRISGIPFLKFKEISARNWKKTRETKAIWLPSKSDRVLVCASQAEMLDKFEEYKIKTSSGWRCIKSNALFGK